MLSISRICFVTLAAACAAIPTSALAAQGDDPDWPCIQRKVPELSLGQIWNGPDLPVMTADQERNAAITPLAAELSARRMPVAEAQQAIRDFAEGLAQDQRQLQLGQLARTLFDHMNRQRSDVISGIGRYAHRQRDMADMLRQEASAVDALRRQPDTDPRELALRDHRLALQTRIFQERVQSLTFVCEVPTLIEQRLYALARTISETYEDR